MKQGSEIYQIDANIMHPSAKTEKHKAKWPSCSSLKIFMISFTMKTMKIIKSWLGAFHNVYFSFTPSLFAKNFNLEPSGSLTEKFNIPVRIVIIISRVKIVNLIFIIFAIMLCNFELIRIINSIFPLFVRVFCDAFFDRHPVRVCISFISFGVSFSYLLNNGSEQICKEKLRNVLIQST